MWFIPFKFQINMNNTKITDLDNDCLEYIFKNLNINDLLSVADSAKHFKQAVELVFKSKSQQKTITLRADPHSEPVAVTQRYICVSDQLVSLKLLRHFGHLIINLDIEFVDQQWVRVFQYLNQYCADSLEKLKLYFVYGAMESIQRPFSKLLVLEYSHCPLDNNSTELNTWFPRLRALAIINCRNISNPQNIKQYFPNLKLVLFGYDHRFGMAISFSKTNIDLLGGRINFRPF